MNDNDKNAAAWWTAITLLTAQVAIVVIGLAAAQALGAFANTAEAWRGLAETVKAIPAWWGLVPGITLLALGGAFCAVRWTTAHARAVEERAINAPALPMPANGREPLNLAERHAAARAAQAGAGNSSHAPKGGKP